MVKASFFIYIFFKEISNSLCHCSNIELTETLAFILFRQHNQAAVVAKHPGKPNPEISKIIGEMWRESSQEAKNLWQRHADVCQPLASIFLFTLS